MGAMKQHQLEQLDREYDEKAHAAQEFDDDVGHKDGCNCGRKYGIKANSSVRWNKPSNSETQE